MDKKKQARSYLDHLAERTKNKPPTKQGVNKVIFLAVKNDVKEALDAGYSAKTIWTDMVESKRVTFCYATFMNYVNKLILQPQIEKIISEENPSDSKPETNKTTKPTTPAGFTFNPIPNKEELI